MKLELYSPVVTVPRAVVGYTPLGAPLGPHGAAATVAIAGYTPLGAPLRPPEAGGPGKADDIPYPPKGLAAALGGNKLPVGGGVGIGRCPVGGLLQRMLGDAILLRWGETPNLSNADADGEGGNVARGVVTVLGPVSLPGGWFAVTL